MNEIDLYEHKTPLPISPTSEGTPMTETHFRQTLYECAVKLRELAYTLPQGVGDEPPRHVRRLQFLERMGSCQVVHRGGTRRSCVSGRCGW
ncbi:hypothetical protein, partial [Mycobacterium tuberculosis]